MKLAFISMLAALFVVMPCLAQASSDARGETSFSADFSFKHPVPLPAEVLALLLQDADKENCSSGTYDKVDASWVSATRITMQTGKPPALLVRGEKGCFIGANTAEYLVYEKSATGWKLIFTDHALAITFLPLVPGQHRKIETTTAMQAGRWKDTRTFIFRDGEYVLVRELSEKINR